MKGLKYFLMAMGGFAGFIIVLIIISMVIGTKEKRKEEELQRKAKYEKSETEQRRQALQDARYNR